jgi:hypothetical protein
VALSGKTPDAVLHGFPLLLSETLQILGIAGPYLHALEVASKDFLEIIPAIN